MITLITGHPGDGKTLLTLDWVQRQAVKEHRTVYYSGIADLKLPWVEMVDPEKWFDCPKGSIIVIDEAQRIFRMRSAGAKVPAHVAELETHRHSGFDLYIVTQNPMLVDTNIRRLIGRHLHLVRKYGMHKAVVHEWARVQEQCEKTRENSIRHEWAYPVAVFQQYKSAEVHTHKRNIPVRVVIMWLMPLVVLGGGWYFFHGIAKPLPSAQRAAADAKAGPLGEGAQVSRGKLQLVTASEYLIARLPRIVDLPESAPVYDALATPKSFPYITGCVASAAKCVCYTDQGTRIPAVSEKTCRQFVAQGAYDHYRAPGGASGGEQNFQSGAGGSKVVGGGSGEPQGAGERRVGVPPTPGPFPFRP